MIDDQQKLDRQRIIEQAASILSLRLSHTYRPSRTNKQKNLDFIRQSVMSDLNQIFDAAEKFTLAWNKPPPPATRRHRARRKPPAPQAPPTPPLDERIINRLFNFITWEIRKK